MKTISAGKVTLLVAILLLLTVSVGIAFSHETPDHDQGGHKERTETLAIPGTIAALWIAITDRKSALHEVLTENHLDEVHHHAFALRDLVAALPASSSELTAERKIALGKSVSRVASLASLLDEAGDVGDSAKVSRLLVKMDSELEVIESLYPERGTRHTQSANDTAMQRYVCPMHSEITSNKPGNCPKCRMSLIARASTGTPTHESVNGMSQHVSGANVPTITASASPVSEWAIGKSVRAVIKLVNSQSGSPLTPIDLLVAHTRKLHLLIIDESLTDYQHEHPEYSGTPGEWQFSFTPHKPGPYRMWADLLPVATGIQEYAITGIKGVGSPEPVRDTVWKLVDTVEGNVYELILDSPRMTAGKATMATLAVHDLKSGTKFSQLEPLMGAYAHLVGFSTDKRTILHIHPLGVEPISDSDRGGPTLEFHIQPNQAGYIRLFAQVQIGGKSEYADFGVIVSKQ